MTRFLRRRAETGIVGIKSTLNIESLSELIFGEHCYPSARLRCIAGDVEFDTATNDTRRSVFHQDAETVHPDSRWTYVGANPRPAKGVYVGRDGVRKFFENILRNLTISAFHTREFVRKDDTVVILGFESGTVNATGNSFRNEWAQKYVVHNGLITEMEEYDVQVEAAS